MKPTFFLAALCGLFLFTTSCTEDQQILSSEEGAELSSTFITDENEDGHTHLPAIDFGSALEAHAEGTSEDYFNAERIQVSYPDGSTATRYLVGGDIELTKVELTTLQGLDAEMESNTGPTIW